MKNRPHPLPLSQRKGERDALTPCPSPKGREERNVLARCALAKESPVPAGLPQKPEGSPAEGRWDFNTPDLASAYADWLKARADVPFYEKQLEDIRKLAAETLRPRRMSATVWRNW